jgi:hypothetical protein
MCHHRWSTAIRPAALGLLAWLCLATAAPGCLPAGGPSDGAAEHADRLDKMRALRGTGDPRRKAKRPSVPPRQEARPR